jgi:hypothetical protein
MLCNEITVVDNGSWICSHAYVVELWVKVPILLQIECIMNGSGNNNLIEVIIAALMKYGGFNKGRHVKKVVMFWCKWGFCFLGGGTSVTTQIKDVWAPFSMGIHWVVHRINLAMQSLSNLTFFSCFDVFMTNLHSYFLHSPKHHLEFQKLVAITETNGNKILKTMKTQWMSILDLSKNHHKIQAIVYSHASRSKSIQMAKVNETPHVQIVFYNFQFSETYKLTKLKSIRFQRIENQIKI